MKISDFVADPTVAHRVVITGITSDKVFYKDIIHYLNQFSSLEKVIIADQESPVYKAYPGLCTVA